MVSRRHLLKAGAAAGVASFAMPTILRAQPASGELTLLTYAGIFQDNYSATVIDPFLQQNPDVRLNYTSGPTSAQMLGTIRAQQAAPQVDVALFDSNLSIIGNEEGLFQKFSANDVPSLEQLFPAARDFAAGYGPAATYDHMVVIYDTENVDPPITKLADLWRPELSGHIVTAAPPSIQGHALMIMVSQMLGVDYRKDVDPAFAKLAELAPSIQTFDPQPDSYTLVLQELARVGTGWNARSQKFADESGGKLGVVTPPEGTVSVVNTINLVNGAPNRELALRFIDYALSAPAQKAFSESMYYGPTNASAGVDPVALARTTSSPENLARLIDVNWAEITGLRDQWQDRWRREVIGA